MTVKEIKQKVAVVKEALKLIKNDKSQVRADFIYLFITNRFEDDPIGFFNERQRIQDELGSILERLKSVEEITDMIEKMMDEIEEGK
jgi:hypothetical protein